jgi:predicted PhzF superfamily epimerase YddE/YHI9
VAEVEAPASLQVVIGENQMLYVGQSQLDLLVELESEEAVRELQPNLDRLASIDVRGLIVTARGSGEYDCVSRFFAPRMGLPEDYVTGSAHCALGPYWAKKLGKDRLLAHQASSRGGVLRLQVQGDRVLIGGQAVTIWRGELSV